MMLVAGMPIGKQEFQYGIGYYMNMLKELKVEVRLNTETTPELIRAEAPYAVICAVGSNELVPSIPASTGRTSSRFAAISSTGPSTATAA